MSPSTGIFPCPFLENSIPCIGSSLALRAITEFKKNGPPRPRRLVLTLRMGEHRTRKDLRRLRPRKGLAGSLRQPTFCEAAMRSGGSNPGCDLCGNPVALHIIRFTIKFHSRFLITWSLVVSNDLQAKIFQTRFITPEVCVF